MKKIENLRERLNTMITVGETDFGEILKVSQELDILIVEYMRQDLS
ncbi:MAG: aspartyl-phosphate phosphatase Spo0E family protein [Clostridia bacterium]|nr:aspartyl-phosphate phosphatase Spo0E family protein [Clostridia bacterium]